MEVKGCVRGITVYDDFAHHPTAITTTVAGLRQKVGGARIIAVLEPRSNTMKLGSMKAALPESLAEADQVFCYGGGVEWDVAAALAPLGSKHPRDEQRRLRRDSSEAAGRLGRIGVRLVKV